MVLIVGSQVQLGDPEPTEARKFAKYAKTRLGRLGEKESPGAAVGSETVKSMLRRSLGDLW